MSRFTALSSTAKIRKGGRGAADGASAAWRSVAGSPGAQATENWNRLPLPGALETEIVPPSSPHSSLQIASPRPVPP